MLAVWEPRLSSWMSWPADVSKILISVPCGHTTWVSQQQITQQLKRKFPNVQYYFFLSTSHTFSDAVAILVPCRLRAMQHSAPSWAGMSTGGFSVLARSTICTWPEWVPGNASRELLLLGHSTHRPEEKRRMGGKHGGYNTHTVLHHQVRLQGRKHCFSLNGDPTTKKEKDWFVNFVWMSHYTAFSHNWSQLFLWLQD